MSAVAMIGADSGNDTSLRSQASGKCGFKAEIPDGADADINIGITELSALRFFAAGIGFFGINTPALFQSNDDQSFGLLE